MMPWPLRRDELSVFETQGLTKVSFEDYTDTEYPPVRRFRATYRRDGDEWAQQRHAAAART